LEVAGKAAHGSQPEKGIDAILPLRSALTEINKIQAELFDREADPLLGHAILHCSMITGGTELSVIPSHSNLQWERRTLPGETQQDLDLEMQRIVGAVGDHAGNHKVHARQLFQRPSYKVPADAEILARLQKASPQSVSVGLEFWADSALSGKAGIPSLLYGPIGHGAHAVDEWVSLRSLCKIYETLKRLIMEF
jgi:acetylornithine deacetylase